MNLNMASKRTMPAKHLNGLNDSTTGNRYLPCLNWMVALMFLFLGYAMSVLTSRLRKWKEYKVVLFKYFNIKEKQHFPD